MAEEAELRYAHEFALLAAELHRDAGEQPTLERIVAGAVQSVEGCDWCGVSVRRSGGEISRPASTDPVVISADELQYHFGEGPCLDAIWEMDMCSIDDMASETRWPSWSPRAAELGIRSGLSVRVEAPAGYTMASLNMYASRPHAFDHTDLAIAGIFARHTGIALADARSQENLRSAMRSRQIIGVAQGILIQRFGLDLDQAFEVLRRYSQDHNVKLRTLSENLVRAGGLPDVADGAAGSTLDDTLTEALGLRGDRRHRDAEAESDPGRSVPES